MGKKPFNREEFLTALKNGEDISCYDLRFSNLSGSDLRFSNLSGSDLSYSNLRGSDLSGSDLSGSDLSYSNLRGSNLRGSDLSGSDLDFSCLPLWCGGLHIKIDKRIACQFAYHFCNQDCDDPEYIAARNAILDFANQFHRVNECGKLEIIKEGE